MSNLTGVIVNEVNISGLSPPPNHHHNLSPVADKSHQSDFDIEMSAIITPNGDDDDTGTGTDENTEDITNEDITDETLSNDGTPLGLNDDLDDDDDGDVIQGIITPNYDMDDVKIQQEQSVQVTVGGMNNDYNNPNVGVDEFIIGDEGDGRFDVKQTVTGSEIKIRNQPEGKYKLNVYNTPNWLIFEILSYIIIKYYY